MEWIETVLMEVNGTKQSPFDIEYSKVNLDLDSMIVTTTTRTTDLVKVSDLRNWKQKQCPSTTSNKDRQLFCQKSLQKFSLMKPKEMVFPEK